MFRSLFRLLKRVFLFLGLLAVLTIFGPRLVTNLYAVNRVFQYQDAPVERVAVVFGAGLRRDGSPTPILRDRVETAVKLYSEHKVEKILMSGDNSVSTHNEPEAMRSYAVALGVPETDIVLDYAGRRTYDTCLRAKIIFGVDRALLITQGFHLPRALFLCNTLGIQSYGVEANVNRYRRSSMFFWNIREQFATTAAFFDLYVHDPTAILGDPEPIFLD